MWLEYTIICIVFETLFELYLNFRQLKHLKKTTKPPDIFKEEITDDEYKKSVEYQIALINFDIVCTFISSSFAAPFLIKIFWDISRYGGEIVHSILFSVLLSLIDEIVSVPMSYYRRFVIDEKFGFNNSTVKLFITDHIKSFLLDNISNSILYSVLIWLYSWAGSKFIPIAGIFFMSFVILLQVLYPIIIMPLFTKLSPLSDGEVKTAVSELAVSTDFSLKEIYQTDDSKRSSKQNAFMFGLFTHKVALADTLLEKCSPEEIKAIVGHEIGHSKHWHIWKLLGIYMASFVVGIYSLDVFLKSDRPFADFGFVGEKPFMIGMMIISFIATPLMRLILLPINMLSRHFEYQADEYAASRGLKLEVALLKISQENKMAVEPEYLYSAFNNSHPTLYQRVVAIRKVQKKSQ